MNYQEIYLNLNKPPLYPAPWIFGVVWPILYLIIILTFGYVFYVALFKKLIPPKITIPFIVNLVANLLFTDIQFTLSNELFALIDVVIVLISIVAAMVMIWPFSRAIAYLQVPYLLWVAFATYLQTGIYFLNR